MKVKDSSPPKESKKGKKRNILKQNPAESESDVLQWLPFKKPWLIHLYWGLCFETDTKINKNQNSPTITQNVKSPKMYTSFLSLPLKALSQHSSMDRTMVLVLQVMFKGQTISTFTHWPLWSTGNTGVRLCLGFLIGKICWMHLGDSTT